METLVRPPGPGALARRDESPSSRRAAAGSSFGAEGDRDLLPVGVVLWVASLARVTYALANREVFGIEATLALVCVVLVAWLFWRDPARAERQR
jgi:hypothetical protein